MNHGPGGDVAETCFSPEALTDLGKQAGRRAASFRFALAFAIIFFPASLFAQSVVVDGSTASTVSIAPSGQISVEIAPANAASISHNSYSAFSVPSAGVDLDNQTVQAATIVNEVTSSAVSLVEGPLTVIGPQADVILANPNGITVNGGTLQNTRNVALTSGVLGVGGSSIVTSTVTSGSVEIGEGGLSGAMEELALISRTLKVDGAINLDTAQSAGHLNIISGDSAVSFDRHRGGFGQGGSGQLPWALVTNPSLAETDTVVVDITGNGSVSAGRISMTVTDQGAGVRFAGDQMASNGGFRLTSSGKLQLAQGRVTAKGSVNISTGTQEFVSGPSKKSEISSLESGVTLTAREGSIDLGQARVSGRIVSSDNLASSGGVTLFAKQNISASKQGDLGAELISQAGDLPNAQNTSNVAVTADGGLSFEGLRATSTDDLRFTAGGPISFTDARGDIGGDFRVFSNGEVSVLGSVFTAQSDMRLDGASLSFGSDNSLESRTELIASEGGLTLVSTSGDVMNFGSLLQGKTATSGDASSLGAVTIKSAGALVNRSISTDRLAVAFGDEADLNIETMGDIRNETGRLFSNSGITIQSGGDVVNETRVTGLVTPLSVTRSRGRRYVSALFLKRSRQTQVSADFGDQAIAGEQSFILGIGDVSITAKNILNKGADISGATLNLNANEGFLNEAKRVGRVSFHQVCRLFCRVSGDADLRFVGGTITASKSLTVAAAGKLNNLSGTISGTSGVTISAPMTKFEPLFSPQKIEQPVGLLGGFRGQRGALSGGYSYGTLQSAAGDITIDGDADIGGADLAAAGTIIVTGSRVKSVEPEPLYKVERRPIGLVWNIFK